MDRNFEEEAAQLCSFLDYEINNNQNYMWLKSVSSNISGTDPLKDK